MNQNKVLNHVKLLEVPSLTGSTLLVKRKTKKNMRSQIYISDKPSLSTNHPYIRVNKKKKRVQCSITL